MCRVKRRYNLRKLRRVHPGHAHLCRVGRAVSTGRAVRAGRAQLIKGRSLNV